MDVSSKSSLSPCARSLSWRGTVAASVGWLTGDVCVEEKRTKRIAKAFYQITTPPHAHASFRDRFTVLRVTSKKHQGWPRVPVIDAVKITRRIVVVRGNSGVEVGEVTHIKTPPPSVTA